MLSASALASHGGHISATVGFPSQGAVAIIVGKNLPTSASDYQATIEWGDSSAPDPNVTASTMQSGNVVGLAASHIYAQPGTFVAKVDILVNDDQPLVATERVQVRPFPARPAPIHVQAHALFNGTLGTSIHALPAGDALTVNWGDGTLEAVTTTASGNRTVIAGTHTWDQGGKYTVSVTKSMVINTNGATNRCADPSGTRFRSLQPGAGRPACGQGR